MARELADLPYARYLEVLDEDLEVEGDYDCAHIRDREFKEIDVRSSRFNESALESLTFAGGNLIHSRFTNVWCRHVDMTGTSLSETSWMDGEIIASAWAGVELIGARMRRVTFHGCKLDAPNFRSGKFQDVVFRDCILREPDFGGAQLTSVTFPGTRIEGLALNKATLKDVDFRGAELFTVSDGIDALRGATISTGQLMDLAPSFAAAVGVVVRD